MENIKYLTKLITKIDNIYELDTFISGSQSINNPAVFITLLAKVYHFQQFSQYTNIAIRAITLLTDAVSSHHEYLVTALSCDDEVIRAGAYWIINILQRTEYFPYLKQALSQDDGLVSMIDLINIINSNNYDIIEDFLLNYTNESSGTKRTNQAILFAKRRKADYLLDILEHDNDPLQRYRAAYFLGYYRVQSAIAAIIAALNDNDENVRFEAARALSLFADPQAVPALCNALHDTDDLVRQEAIWALGIIKDRNTVSCLATLLKDSSADIRIATADALGEIGDNAAVGPLICQLHKEVDSLARSYEVSALGMIKDERILVILQHIRDNDRSSMVRDSANEAINVQITGATRYNGHNLPR